MPNFIHGIQQFGTGFLGGNVGTFRRNGRLTLKLSVASRRQTRVIGERDEGGQQQQRGFGGREGEAMGGAGAVAAAR